MDDAFRAPQAAAVARLPRRPARPHRLFEKVRLLERHDDVELDPPIQQRLGGDEVGAAGQRAIGEADLLLVEDSVDGRADPRLVRAARAEHMAAIMEHARRPQRCHQRRALERAHPEMGADHAELAQGRGAAAQIGASPDRFAGQHVGDLGGAAKQQQRFRPRRRLPVVGGGGDGRVGEQGLREGPTCRIPPCEQGQGGGVDPGEAVLRRLVDVVIGLERQLHRRLPRGARRGVEGAVLQDARADRPLVDIAGAFEAIFGELRHRPVGVAHPREREDLLMADRAAVVAGFDRGDGRVIGADQVAARQGLPGNLGGFAHAAPYGR